LEKGREDIIVAGTAVLMITMDRLGCSEILVSDYGLREGILLDFYLNKYETKEEKKLEPNQRRRWMRKPAVRAHSTKKGEKGYTREKSRKELREALEEILKHEMEK
jgi:exopolyphosphatase/pppGpp-phosphohydrolase